MTNSRRTASPVLAFLLFILALCAAAALFIKYRQLPPDDAKPENNAVLSVTPCNGAGRERAGLELFSKSAIMFCPDNGEVLYKKNADERIYPASLTKIMTALVAVESIADLNTPVTLEYEDYRGLYEQNAAMAGFSMGETVPARDLLYATLLPSGAEAAAALSRAAAGSQEKCIELMNLRAKQLGMSSTHFTNITGLHDDMHYTTASDMALLLAEALKNKSFTEAFSALGYVTSATDEHPNGIALTSTLVSRLKQLNRDRAPITGNKTGFTDEAQLCLASVAESAKTRLAVISVGAPGDGASEPTHLEDAYLLYQKAMD